ncbi:MAG: ribonuclease Z [Candidatus Micrarchaeota archaeon]
MLKITFLGTSASIPTVNRSMPSVALKAKELYLWDCGEGTQRQMMKYRIGFGSVKAIFISHLHLDHFLGVFGLIETLRLSSVFAQKLLIYAPQKFQLLLPKKWDFLEINEIKPGLLLKDGEGEISAFKVKHVGESFGFVFKEYDILKFYEEKAHALGLKGEMFRRIQEQGFIKIGKNRIELEDVTWLKKGRKIVYSGDCSPSSNVIKSAKNADLLIHDATYDKKLEDEAKKRSHSTAVQAAEIASEAEVKKLVLTHISGRYSNALQLSQLLKEAKKIFPNTIVAEDGLGLEL